MKAQPIGYGADIHEDDAEWKWFFTRERVRKYSERYGYDPSPPISNDGQSYDFSGKSYSLDCAPRPKGHKWTHMPIL